MAGKPSYTDREYAEAVAEVSAHPEWSKSHTLEWVKTKLHQKSLNAVYPILKGFPSAASQRKEALVTTVPPPTTSLSPTRIEAPTDILQLRVDLINHLYNTMQTGVKAEDRTSAAKELGRLTGLHRESVQDKVAALTVPEEEDAVKCRRLAVALRKALGLPLDDLPKEVLEGCPQGTFPVADPDVLPVPSQLDNGFSPFETVQQDAEGGDKLREQLLGPRTGDDPSGPRDPAVQP